MNPFFQTVFLACPDSSFTARAPKVTDCSFNLTPYELLSGSVEMNDPSFMF